MVDIKTIGDLRNWSMGKLREEPVRVVTLNGEKCGLKDVQGQLTLFNLESNVDRNNRNNERVNIS